VRRSAGRYLFLAVPPLFYLWTTAPGIGYAEQAIIIDWMLRGTLGTGASHHNLTILAGYLFSHLLPFQEIAYRCNLVSAFFGALAVGVFYCTALRLTGRTLLAVAAATLLMVSHSMWWLSTIAEVHALNALFCTAILYCLVRFEQEGRQVWLRGAAFAGGLSLFNHLQLGIWLPAILLVAWLSTPGPWLARARGSLHAAAWWLAGLVPYALVFLWEVNQAGLASTASDASGGEFSRAFLVVYPWSAFLAQVTSAARLFMLQWGWPSPFWLFIATGAAVSLRSSRLPLTNAAVGVAFVFNTGFFSFYGVWDKFTFLLPSFILLNYLGALGLGWSWHTWFAPRRVLRLAAGVVILASCLFPVTFFRQLPELARESEFWGVYRSNPPSRLWMVDGEYLANPNKRQETSVHDYVNALLEHAPENALIVDHSSRTFFQIDHHRRLYGRRKDLRLVQLVPAGYDPGRWRSGYAAESLVDLIDQRVGSQSVLLTAVAGLDPLVRGLANRHVTLVERPLGVAHSVYEARRATDVDWSLWFDRVELSESSLIVYFTEHNPPALLRVDWESSSGGRVTRGPFPVPFDVSPMRVEPPSEVRAGGEGWSATVYFFDQPVASLEIG
jgi:4-amino-4-deoxy-L-arabinose transferase-like glycosyltransferase